MGAIWLIGALGREEDACQKNGAVCHEVDKELVLKQLGGGCLTNDDVFRGRVAPDGVVVDFDHKRIVGHLNRIGAMRIAGAHILECVF